jgi:hypothetical protein
MPNKPVPTLTMVFEFDGKTIHKETSGFEGKLCTEQTDFLDKALSQGKEEKRYFKPEYHARRLDTYNRNIA